MGYYDEDIVSCIDSRVTSSSLFYEWYIIVEDILRNPEFQKRKLFMHHHNLSVWDHSILVSFKSFAFSKKFGANAYVCAVAGLLHDFYSQAWISTPELESLENGRYTTLMKEKKPWYKMHGFTHAKDAALNYVKYFPELEDKRITNSIKRHMFPLNIIPPRYMEGYIITIVDKLNSVRELPSVYDISKRTVYKIHNFLFGNS